MCNWGLLLLLAVIHCVFLILCLSSTNSSHYSFSFLFKPAIDEVSYVSHVVMVLSANNKSDYQPLIAYFITFGKAPNMESGSNCQDVKWHFLCLHKIKLSSENSHYFPGKGQLMKN